MHLGIPIQYHAPYIQRGIFPQKILLLMLRKSSGKMWAGLANIDGTATITGNFKYHMGFNILVKGYFKVGKQVLTFLVLELN